MQLDIYEDVVRTQTTKELTLTKIVCDRCSKDFVIYQKNKVLSTSTGTTDIVSMTVTIPNQMFLGRSEKITKHYCHYCWKQVEALL